MTWRLDCAGPFYDANEGSVVYYDPRSGDTHLISDFAGFIIQQFAGQALTTAELIQRIAPEVEGLDDAELEQSVSTVLSELLALDVLKRE